MVLFSNVDVESLLILFTCSSQFAHQRVDGSGDGVAQQRHVLRDPQRIHSSRPASPILTGPRLRTLECSGVPSVQHQVYISCPAIVPNPRPNLTSAVEERTSMRCSLLTDQHLRS